MQGKKIEEFIKECFEIFHFNYKEYFYYDFDEKNHEEIVWLEEDGSIIKDAVKHASEILGISVENLMNAKEDSIHKWLDKYPYFRCIPWYNYTYDKSFHSSKYDMFKTMEAIFNTDLSEQYQLRFNYDDIIRRMIEKLKLKDIVEPGTFHKNASIRNLRIGTENFSSYNKIDKMTISFIEMISNVKTLFLKAVKTDLNEEEIEEYNFLVTALGVRDRYYVKGYLYYSQLVKVREYYRELTNDNFNSSIVFKKVFNFKPWRYTEFIEDKNLVQQYLDFIPEAKGMMREYVMAASRFECIFTWSDAERLYDSQEEEDMLSEFNRIIGEEDISDEQRSYIPTVVYIDKTSEELNGAERTVEKIMEYCRPVKMGGLKIKMPSEYDSLAMVKRIGDFIGKVESSNYVQRMLDRWGSLGGACNE